MFIDLVQTGLKLNPKSIKCVFLGYSNAQKRYKYYCPKSRKSYVTKDVTFFECEPYFSQKEDNILDNILLGTPVLSSPVYLGDKITEDSKSSNDKPLKVYTRRKIHLEERQRFFQKKRPLKISIKNSHLMSQLCLLRILPLQSEKTKGLVPIILLVTLYLISPLIPLMCLFFPLYKVFKYPEKIVDTLSNPEWRKAMMEEMQELERQNTWEVVDLHQGKSVIGCKWAFTSKNKSDGTLERYKARLVANDISQRSTIEYEETFAPITKMTSVRLALALAT